MKARRTLRFANRLTTPRDFRLLFAEGRRMRVRPFVVLVRPNALAIARLGIAVAKRYVPDAVDRNYLKRLVRETFRERANHLGALDVVIQYVANSPHPNRRSLITTLGQIWSELTYKNRHG